MTLEGFKVPKDPHPDEPDELSPDTAPIDDVERKHPSPDRVAHREGVRPDYLKRKVGEGAALGDEADSSEPDRP